MKRYSYPWIGLFVALLMSVMVVGKPTTRSVTAQTEPAIEGCPVLPSNNVWNTPIDRLPVHANSTAYIGTIGPTKSVHPDFGSGLWNGGPIGIPYNVVSGIQAKVPITFDFSDESDPGPYPIPSNAAIEGGSQSTGDRHVLVLDKDNCILYETWSTYPNPDGSWTAGSGSVFNLHSNTLRPSGWTSADAAGLPILPGLVRYEEVAGGEIRHALRFTAPNTRREFIWPARHYASDLTALNYPPMGQRFRLKADVDVSGFSPEVQVILRALKKYGMILADNGSAWFISGVPDSRWNNDVLVSELRNVLGSDFEAVDETSLMVNSDSGQAAALDIEAIQTLVAEYYNDILDRAPEPGGEEFWTQEVERTVLLGIDVKEGFEGLAKFLFDSQEYQLKSKNNTDFVTDLYQTFLNRSPDTGGINFWVGYLNQGLTRNMLITQFAISEEFKLYMENLFGDASARYENRLVNDLYRGFLNRFPDTDGFNAWVGMMRTAQCTGPQAVRDLAHEIVFGFIQSAEYVSRGRTNQEYVEDLYDGILHRGADPSGFNYWVNLLNVGAYTRGQMLPLFTNSAEFQFRVQEVINAGCMP